MLNIIKSYLVSLGFQVNQAEYQKAEGAINELGRTVQAVTSGMARNFAVAATSVTSAIVAINAATAGLVTQVASADMQYQKFALRMWTTKETAKELQSTLKAMGEEMEDVAWIPELRQQYSALLQEGRKMQTPGDAGSQLKYVRSILFEFKRMKLEVQYASEWIAYYLGKYLAGPLANIKKQLASFNDKLVATMPDWTKKVAQVLAIFMSVSAAGIRAIKGLYNGAEQFFAMLPRGAKIALAAILGVWTVLRMHPIGMVMTALSMALLLIEDFYGYIDGRKSSKTLAPVWQKLLDWFDKASPLVSEFAADLSELWDKAADKVSRALAVLNKYWGVIRDSDVIKSGLRMINALWQVMKEVVSAVSDATDSLFDACYDLFSYLVEDGTVKAGVDLFSALFTTVSNLILGILNLTKHMRQFWKDAAGTQAARTMWDWFKVTVGFILKMVAALGKSFLGLFDMIGLGLQGKFEEAAKRGKKIFSDFKSDFGDAVTSAATGGKVHNQKMMALAQKVSKETGLPAQWIYGQWYHESGGFSSQLSRENFNFSGLTQSTPNDSPQPDGNMYYIKFNSPEEFAEYFTKYIKLYAADGIFNARTVEEYAHALKRGGYYGDSEENYASGIRGGMNTYSPDAQPVTYSGAAYLARGYSAARAGFAAYTGSSDVVNGGYSANTVINVGGVYITQPAATPAQVTQAVVSGVQQSQGRSTARQIRELNGVIL